MPGELRVCTGVDEFDREEWSGVVDAARAPAFYDYAFLRAYERAPLQKTDAFFYLMFGMPAAAVLPAYVQAADEALGTLPAHGLPGRLPGDQILLTHVAHCYDTSFPARPRLLTPALVERACAALAELARQAGAKWFAFQNVDGSGELAASLAAIGLAKVPMNPRFRHDAAGYASVEEYVAAIPSKKARHSLRRSQVQAHRVGMRITSPDPAGGARDAVELCRQTTARHGTAAYYPAHLDDFMALAASLVRVTEVRLRGRLASAAICLADSMRFHLWAGGLDYEAAAEVDSSFPLMLWPALAETIALGLPVFEAGRGNADAKLRYHLDPVPLFAFVGCP